MDSEQERKNQRIKFGGIEYQCLTIISEIESISKSERDDLLEKVLDKAITLFYNLSLKDFSNEAKVLVEHLIKLYKENCKNTSVTNQLTLLTLTSKTLSSLQKECAIKIKINQ